MFVASIQGRFRNVLSHNVQSFKEHSVVSYSWNYKSKCLESFALALKLMPQVYQKQAQIKALAISFMKLQYINMTLPGLVEFQKMTYFLVILTHWTTTTFKHTLTPYHTSVTL